jgi:hypothetical protein
MFSRRRIHITFYAAILILIAVLIGALSQRGDSRALASAQERLWQEVVPTTLGADAEDSDISVTNSGPQITLSKALAVTTQGGSSLYLSCPTQWGWTDVADTGNNRFQRFDGKSWVIIGSN